MTRILPPEGHTRRVATLAVAIGERLGLTEGQLRQLALGGLLHDVGKLSVPNAILNKPDRPTDSEFAGGVACRACTRAAR
ncbi:MAG TPA: HD domain-containing protein [Solirubrobacteraceae bacterium]|nr:HD domain-containing protein [Solirubrobacteraceae bacterium]